MKKLLLLSALIFVTPAVAQPVNDVTLKVNKAELALIGKGLGQLPFNDVSGLFKKLQMQIAEQQKKTEKPVANPEPKK